MSFEIYEPLKIATFGGSHLNVYLIIDLTKCYIFYNRIIWKKNVCKILFFNLFNVNVTFSEVIIKVCFTYLFIYLRS